MDLDQLKKINQLSSELKRHNMADSSTDAYSQAQGIITVTQKAAPQSSMQEAVVKEAPANALAERQFTIELERVQKAYTEELDVLRNAVNKIITEVNTLREDLSKVQAQPKQKEKQAELPKAEKKESHPRQGNFTPQDVDMQKMFYFGNKK